MGSSATISADVSRASIDSAHSLVRNAEQRWSRFRADSVVTAINRSVAPVVVDRGTAELLGYVSAARTVTDGWFDAGPSNAGVCPPRYLDLGGVAKGWTADLVTAQLVADGAAVAVADIGGDVRVRSTRPVLIECEAPDRISPAAILSLSDAGVAMSGPTRNQGHLVDPGTGRPTSTRVAVVVSRTAAGAEVLATATAVAPLADAIRILARTGAAAWLIESDGSVTVLGRPERFVADPGWLTAARTRTWMRVECPLN